MHAHTHTHTHANTSIYIMYTCTLTHTRTHTLTTFIYQFGDKAETVKTCTNRHLLHLHKKIPYVSLLLLALSGKSQH